MKVEIRCCCRPEKLLGWVDVPDRLVIRDGSVSFALTEFRARDGNDYVGDVLTLPFGRYSPHPLAETRLALKSEETPLETLKRIPGFEAAS